MSGNGEKKEKKSKESEEEDKISNLEDEKKVLS
jgi:hypothetical protein